MDEVRWSRSSPAVEVEPESDTESPDRGPKAEVRRSGPSPEADFDTRATKHSENIPKPNPNITTPTPAPHANLASRQLLGTTCIAWLTYTSNLHRESHIPSK